MEQTEQSNTLTTPDETIYKDGIHTWITPDGITLLDGALVTVTGAKGTGKSLFAAGAVGPNDTERVYYDDSEFSSNRTMQELRRLEQAGITKPFGVYNDLESMFADDLPEEKDLLYRINQGQLPWVTGKQKNALSAYYEETLKRLDKYLKRDHHLVYVHDTIAKLEAGMAAWVETHRGYGKGKAGWTSEGYGRMWSEAVYPLYEQLIKSIFDRGVKVIVLTSHLKVPWIGKGKNAHPIPGKVVPQGKKVLTQLSSLMLWLVKDYRNWDGAPAGIVMKQRMHKMSVTKRRRWRNRQALPPRVPHLTWWEDLPEDENDEDFVSGSLERYLKEGVKLASLSDREQLSRDEATMVSETLNDVQWRFMISTAQTNLERERQLSASMGLGVSREVFDTSALKARTRVAADIAKSNVQSAERKLVEDVKTKITEAKAGGMTGDAIIDYVLSVYAPPTHGDVKAALDVAMIEIKGERHAKDSRRIDD